MAVPWLQIVQLVPSLVDVSRELLKKNKAPAPHPNVPPHSLSELELRVATLEDNERKQAELVSQIAEQLAMMTKVVVEQRSKILWLAWSTAIAVILAIVALVWNP